ncbi:immunoglobulin-like domain-containing protein [uncultured Aquimarina sp.]|uniref:immunoglobulin-like domain-containing protein n=1 Tax=uncultured Aquimarina sp. TaxID=575652 RepID=UPI00263985C5|nr:immunoglobulin-like domain-containing protein [uncultured Aquimarina sp.]
MKRKLLLILTLLVTYGYAQTECPLDESKFSGTVTISGIGASETKASDATSNHRFGERVAIDGNIAAVASRSNGAAAGKVYVFINDGSGNWSQQTILTASDGFAGDNFGSAVAIEGNYLVVGARSQLNVGGVDTGAAYLFEYNGVSTWTEVAVFEPSDGSSGDRFGESASIEGNLILIGARNGCTGGCAYIYENDGTNTFTYTETKLEPQVQSNYDGARFGYDVLVNDGRAYVGGPQDYSSVGNFAAGSVQIWDQENDGSWTRTHRLRGTETSEYFGSGISVQGDYLAIGAYNYEVSSTPEADQGRVYVYKVDGNGDYLDANRVMIQNDDKDSYNDQRFGTDVALEDGFLYVGTFGNGASNTDAVYMFKDDGTNNWTQISKITSDAGWDEFSNRAVAVSFPTLLIGQNEGDSPSNSGSVYFVQLNNDVQPVASVTETIEASPSQSNGAIKVIFSDEATETQIKFSVDGGATYPYVFDDTLGSGEITNLAANTYDVWVAFDETSCPINLGNVTVNEIRYTAIPDANFEAELESLGYDDISGDNQVPTALIEVVTNLDVSNQSIADLTGIQDFTALVSLNCEDNSLTNLDVSNNINLQTLIFDNNNVSALTLGVNTNLDSIEGRYNQLTTIDLSQNPNLTFINLRDNLFTTVDVSSNPLLETINLRGCTNLISIDISSNPNAKFLYFQDTALMGLDVSQNTLLEVIVVERVNFNAIDVSNLSVLRQLRIADNSFTALDVSNNPLLERLECENNNLSYLNIKNGNNTIIPNADFIATGNPLLTCILVDNASWSTTNWTNKDGTASFSDADYCRYTAIPDANFEAALEALGYDDISGDGQVPTALIEGVTSLNVNSQSISDVTGIQDFIALTSLVCISNNLTSIDLSSNTQLTDLNVSRNDLTSIDISNNVSLKSFLAFETDLSSIDFTNNSLLEKIDLNRVATLTAIDVSNLSNLKNLILYRTGITSIDVSNNPQLDELRLDYTDLTSLDVSNNLLLTNLKTNASLITSLDLTLNVGLTRLEAFDGDLEHLNVKNGNNTNITFFDIKNNPSLDCVLVDDASYSNTNWINIGATTSFTDTNYCRYTSILDAIFEARLEALGYDDISGDGQVPTALIEVVTSLNVNDLGINDLTGIDDFTALVTLNCRGNNLSTLDISQNILLETLAANNNDLPSIDVSNNTALKSINLGANNLTTLDISNNTALQILSLQVNSGLTSIDISNNVLLEQLRTYSTNIASLDLSTHPNLEILQAYNSALTAMDVSNNPVLEELRVNGTSVTELDLSNNPNIKSLRVNDTGIQTLDLSNQIALQNLFAYDTNLSYLNVKNGNNTNVGTFRVESNPNLSCIIVDDATYSTTNWSDIDNIASFTDADYCRYTAIPDPVFEARLEALGYDDISGDGQVPTALIEGVTYLYVPANGVADLTGIEDFLALERLICSGNNLSALDLSTNTLLEEVDVSNNDITSIDISNSPVLEELNLRENKLNSIDVTNNIALLDLDLSGSDITNLDISNNTLLTHLNVDNNDMTLLDVSNTINLKVLEISGLNITTLDLSNNTLLEELICSYTTLIQLDVSTNIALTYLECEESNQLTSLDLSTLPLLDEVILNDNALLNALNIKNGNNTSLSTFDATGNPNLTCILVDDAAYSTTNWTSIDLTASFSDTYCNYTAIPDAIFEAELEALGYDDISGDGQVPTALIEVVTILNVNNKGITDLTGIEDFVALTSLTVSDNNLGTIDVSNNINLKTLDCQFAGLSALDVSSNTVLENLYANGNSISSIDVTNNVNLVQLGMYDNDLTLIDVSNNIALTVIDLFGNQLTAIDVSNNLLLRNLLLESNNLTSLDVSANTALKNFTCNSNALTSLNIQSGANTNINSFNVTNNPNLYCVLVDDQAYSITNWTNIDVQTNFATDCSVTPMITLNGANPQTIELGVGYTELGATADDGSSVSIDISEFMDAVGSYTIYYDATNALGNAAVQLTRTVNVVDTTAPVITLIGDNPQTIELGAGYSELGATTDDGTEITIDASEFMDAVGSYTIYYDATDAASNAAVQLTRTVNVVDTTAPVITLIGDNPQTIELGAGYSELGATTDDGTEITIDASEFMDAVGSYTIYYDATDAASNAAVQITRTINVVDTTAPIITLNGANPQTIELGAGYMELGATTDDGSSISIDASEFMNAVGSYTIRYNAIDASSNVAVEVTRTVNVVDTTAPIIMLNGANPQTIELGAGYTELGATTDDGSSVSIDTSEFMDVVGSYTIYYDATDVAGNAAVQVTRTVNVVDTTNPTVVCQNITVQLDDSGNVSITAAMIDNGSADISGITSLTLDITDFDCATIGDNVVVLTVTDTNGNSDMCMATVTIEDRIDPEFDMATVPTDMNVTFDTGDMYTLADFTSGVVVTDNCDTNRSGFATTITQTPAAGTLLGAGDHVIILTATDDNANEQTTTFTITVTDDILSVGENTGEVFTLYPNPAKQQFQVSGFSGEAVLSIYDVHGRSLLIEKVDAGQSISIQELPNGAYFVKIAIGNTYETIRLIKNE